MNDKIANHCFTRFNISWGILINNIIYFYNYYIDDLLHDFTTLPGEIILKPGAQKQFVKTQRGGNPNLNAKKVKKTINFKSK